jgi:hypothetical protein
MSIRQTLVTSFFESLSPGFQNPSKNPGFSSSAFCRTKNCSNLLKSAQNLQRIHINFCHFSLPE